MTFKQALDKITIKLTAGEEAKRLTVQVKQPTMNSEVFVVNKDHSSAWKDICILTIRKFMYRRTSSESIYIVTILLS